MGMLKSAADLVYTIRFLRLLTTPIEETDAFKAGIIDANGERIKTFNKEILANRQAYDEHYTSFHRLVYNLKKIMAKAPGGNSVLARYGAALALIKENGELSTTSIEKIHAATGIDILDVLSENSNWFILKTGELSPGTYRIQNNSMTKECIEVVMKGDQVKVLPEKTHPVDSVLGINIYEVLHIRSNRNVLVSAGELTK